MTIEEAYMRKENRDRRAKELRGQGYAVRRYSYRNQLLHPQYVRDWPYPLTAQDRGIGNTLYKTHFKALYCLEAKKEEA